jgi:hypothetical protein
MEWGVSRPLADYLGPDSKVGVPAASGQVNSEQSCLFTAFMTSLRWYDTASLGWILQHYYTYCTQCLAIYGKCFISVQICSLALVCLLSRYLSTVLLIYQIIQLHIFSQLRILGVAISDSLTTPLSRP